MTTSHGSRVLEQLGVRSWINAQNWSTTLGGSVLDDRVVEAMADVAHVFCDMNELLANASRRVAELCKVDAAFITCGAAAGIVLATASCITGGDTRKMSQLFGETSGREQLRNEVVMQAPHRTNFDYQYWQAGGRLIHVGFPALGVEPHHIEDAISDKTACIVYVHSWETVPRGLPFGEVVKIARSHDVPTIVDTAGILPPAANLHKFTDMGADLVIFSGGKAIRGPNDSGIILGGGERGVELIEACTCIASPNSGIGRPFKVSKEQIAGLVIALEIFVKRNEKAEYEELMDKARFMASRLSRIDGLIARIIPNDSVVHEHPASPHVPRVYMEWDKERFGFDAEQLDRMLANEDPPIALRLPWVVGYTTTARCVRLIDTYFFREGEERMVADRLHSIFGKVLK